MNVFERIRTTTEELIFFTKKQRAVLSFLDRNVLRSHFSDATPSLDETGLFRHFARFAVV